MFKPATTDTKEWQRLTEQAVALETRLEAIGTERARVIGIMATSRRLRRYAESIWQEDILQGFGRHTQGFDQLWQDRCDMFDHYHQERARAKEAEIEVTRIEQEHETWLARQEEADACAQIQADWAAYRATH